MAKLFKITAEFDFVVRADNEDDAWLLARRKFHDAARDEDDASLMVDEITEERQLPKHWRGCLPYAARGEPEETVETVLLGIR